MSLLPICNIHITHAHPSVIRTTHPSCTHAPFSLTHRWVSVPTPWTDYQAGTKTAVVTVLIMGSCIMREARVLHLVQHAQMETGWVVEWTFLPTVAVAMSVCSSLRMGKRLEGVAHGCNERCMRARWGRCRAKSTSIEPKLTAVKRWIRLKGEVS